MIETEKIVKEEDDSLQETYKVLNRVRKIRIVNIWAARVFLTVLFAIAVFAMIIPLRPQYSESEKRELSVFPKFSIESLFSGEYFRGIDNWYSDTFPARDIFTKVNTAITTLFGKSEVIIHGEVEEGDAIPSVEAVTSEDEFLKDNSSETPPENAVSDTSSLVSEPIQEQPSSVTQSGETSSLSQVEPTPPITQTLGALLINGDSAYEYYNFVQNVADTYTSSINRAGVLLAGRAQVYDIIVPTGMGITAPDDLVVSVKTSDQKSAIDYMHSKLSTDVKYIPIYDVLKSRNNEYLYFRTDHHWTSLAAYYTYCEFIQTKGLQPLQLDQFVEYEFNGFLGTFYNTSGKLPQLAKNPDTVFAYQPASTNTLSIFNGSYWYDSYIISDMTKSSASNKYSTFIRGDNALSKISNPNLSDGSTCIVIKESFGNAFVPFLVPHYQTVYIVDYRHIPKVDSRGLAQLQVESGAQDVIFINNISATRNASLMNSVSAYIR